MGGKNPANPVGSCTVAPNGRLVVFQAWGSDELDGTPAPVAPATQVYSHDPTRGNVQLVSSATDGTPGNGSSGVAAQQGGQISTDNTKVAFTSVAG